MMMIIIAILVVVVVIWNKVTQVKTEYINIYNKIIYLSLKNQERELNKVWRFNVYEFIVAPVPCWTERF